ncbi:uracil-DNA glycosylase family protein [Thiothrix eikelboomii]|uniref:uracil-DNA glycosylase family protein n=1 Tax=Thiothrix eikelboomii TaxID=92487 RepID=UPI003BB1589F
MDDFEKLIVEIKNCKLCPRMHGITRVIGYSCGKPSSPIMFIGEAPGRLGADDTQIPFHGDRSGHNFEGLLKTAGISRSDIFVTNSVLCNPRNEKGNNDTPTSLEVINCSENLKKQIELVNPKVIVTLGAKALQSLNFIESHKILLKEGVRKDFKWYGRLLIPLYHPGQRAMLHRSYANQQSDYKFVADTFSKLDISISKRKVYGQLKIDVELLVEYLFYIKPFLSYFSLHKIIYLAEYYFYKRKKYRFTSAYFIRQKDGPYCTDLHIQKMINTFADLHTSSVKGKLFIKMREHGLFDNKPSLQDDSEDKKIMIDIINNLKDLSDEDLKRKAYLSLPMKKILKKEKLKLEGCYNEPIEFEE